MSKQGNIINLVRNSADNVIESVHPFGGKVSLSALQIPDLFHASPNAMLFVDRDGIILASNDKAGELLGTSPSKIVGCSVEDFVPPEIRSKHPENRRNYFANPEPRPMGIGRYLEARRVDGTLIPVEISLCPVVRDAVTYVVVIIVDVSLLKAKEREVEELTRTLERRVEEKTAILQAANQEMESFTYAVAHDLRAPVRGILGFAEALREEFSAALKSNERYYVEQIISASERMKALIDGLLSLAKIMNVSVDIAEVDVSALAKKIVEQLTITNPTRSVRWDIQENVTCYGDPSLLESVISNLLENSWKYTSKVEAPTIRFFQESRNGKTYVCVSDNGAGFDMNHSGLLFKPFQRLHRQDEFPGVGIGLATVHRIVRKLGGEITFEGTPGLGATFAFYTPSNSGRAHG